MPSLARAIVVSGMLTLVILGLVPLTIAASSAQPSTGLSLGASQGSSNPNIGKAPVSIHFKPKSVSGVQGGSVTVHATVKNAGAFDFVATGCELWYRLGTSGGWSKAGVCLKQSDFPITFSADSKTRFSATQSISQTFPTGVYQWKIELVGTYNGAASVSHPGTLTVTIT